MFLPVKADFHLPRFPILTLIICLVCIGVFIKQQSDWKDFGMAIERFCNAGRSHIEQIVFERIAAAQDMDTCGDIMYTIANDPAREESEVIAEMASKIRPLTGFNVEDSREYVRQMLEEETRRFNMLVPPDPDEGLAYYTGSWNPVTMLTSSFAHGDWGHIIFNLVFFFAFAATVEVLIGPIWYVAFVLVDSWFIGLTGSMAAAATDQHYYTLGLSGVVMGMMGLFAYLLPRGKIKCYYFFIIIFGSVAVPAWVLTAWYLGGDIFTLLTRDDYGSVNVLAHVMGGIGGYLFGLLFLREIRKDAAHTQDALVRVEREKRFR
ncbi:MAG: rhomboid family intramembrane serine protease, partial [Gammaproteobacteria bacterium]|nr:rhomboid family intramembrane serine protease [Gammaproteobacteria bacterium]